MLPSFGTISSLVAQVSIAIFISVIYIFLIACIFPAVFLKPEYNKKLEGDRGLKKYRFEGGASILYEPSVEVKRYIKQYILTAVGNEKYIQCKFDFRVFSSRYEVFAFDCDNRMIDAIQIEEKLSENGNFISRPALLPANTAYVKVSVKAVNEMKIPRDPLLDIPAFKIAVFRFFTVIFTIMEAFMMKSVVLSVAGMFFSYDFEGNDSGNLFTLLLAIVIGLMLSSCGRTLHGLGKREKEDLKDYKKRLKNEVRK